MKPAPVPIFADTAISNQISLHLVRSSALYSEMMSDNGVWFSSSFASLFVNMRYQKISNTRFMVNSAKFEDNMLMGAKMEWRKYHAILTEKVWNHEEKRYISIIDKHISVTEFVEFDAFVPCNKTTVRGVIYRTIDSSVEQFTTIKNLVSSANSHHEAFRPPWKWGFLNEARILWNEVFRDYERGRGPIVVARGFKIESTESWHDSGKVKCYASINARGESEIAFDDPSELPVVEIALA